MAVLSLMASRADYFDKKTGADTRAIRHLQEKVAQYQAEHARIPQLTDLMLIIAVAFGVTGFSHLLADSISPLD
ncbi:membrane protein [Alishewanella longhuensis]